MTGPGWTAADEARWRRRQRRDRALLVLAAASVPLVLIALGWGLCHLWGALTSVAT